MIKIWVVIFIFVLRHCLTQDKEVFAMYKNLVVNLIKMCNFSFDMDAIYFANNMPWCNDFSIVFFNVIHDLLKDNFVDLTLSC